MSSENRAVTKSHNEKQVPSFLLKLVEHRVKTDKSIVFKQQALNFWNLWP